MSSFEDFGIGNYPIRRPVSPPPAPKPGGGFTRKGMLPEYAQEFMTNSKNMSNIKSCKRVLIEYDKLVSEIEEQTSRLNFLFVDKVVESLTGSAKKLRRKYPMLCFFNGGVKEPKWLRYQGVFRKNFFASIGFLEESIFDFYLGSNFNLKNSERLKQSGENNIFFNLLMELDENSFLDMLSYFELDKEVSKRLHSYYLSIIKLDYNREGFLEGASYKAEHISHLINSNSQDSIRNYLITNPGWEEASEILNKERYKLKELYSFFNSLIESDRKNPNGIVSDGIKRKLIGILIDLEEDFSQEVEALEKMSSSPKIDFIMDNLINLIKMAKNSDRLYELKVKDYLVSIIEEDEIKSAEEQTFNVLKEYFDRKIT